MVGSSNTGPPYWGFHVCHFRQRLCATQYVCKTVCQLLHAGLYVKEHLPPLRLKYPQNLNMHASSINFRFPHHLKKTIDSMKAKIAGTGLFSWFLPLVPTSRGFFFHIEPCSSQGTVDMADHNRAEHQQTVPALHRTVQRQTAGDVCCVLTVFVAMFSCFPVRLDSAVQQVLLLCFKPSYELNK